MSQQMKAFNTRLIHEVEKHQCLYDYSCRDYSRKDITNLAWEAIGKELNERGATCKEVYRNLRGSFVKSLRAPPSGSSERKKKDFYLKKEMMFLVHYIKGTNTLPGNLPSPPDTTPNSPPDEEMCEPHTSKTVAALDHDLQSAEGNEITEIQSSELQLPASKQSKKKTTTENFLMDYLRNKTTTTQSTQCRKYYLLSLLPDVEHMSDSQFRSFRRTTQDAIDNILDPSHASTPTFQSYSPVNTYTQSPPSTVQLQQDYNISEGHQNPLDLAVDLSSLDQTQWNDHNVQTM